MKVATFAKQDSWNVPIVVALGTVMEGKQVARPDLIIVKVVSKVARMLLEK